MVLCWNCASAVAAHDLCDGDFSGFFTPPGWLVASSCCSGCAGTSAPRAGHTGRCTRPAGPLLLPSKPLGYFILGCAVPCSTLLCNVTITIPFHWELNAGSSTRTECGLVDHSLAASCMHNHVVSTTELTCCACHVRVM